MQEVDQSKVYDFIIIGSGIGGLVTALVLLKNNFSVCILEKNQQIGGALQVFSRDKCIFDTGVHYIGGLDEGENLNKIFKYLGIYDDLKLSKLDDAFDIIRLQNGKEFKVGQGYSNFRSLLLQDFPQEGHAIDTFIEKIQEICTYFPLYNLRLDGELTYYNNPEILAINAWEYVSSLTENEELIATLLGNGFLYAGDRKRTPLHVVALILNSYIKGSYRIQDGGAQLVKSLVKQIRNHQGDIFKRKEVCSGVFNDNGDLVGVETVDGEIYYARQFVSNAHPLKTMELIGENRFMPATLKRMRSLKNTVSSFVVNISLKENSLPYFNYNYYDFFTPEIWNETDRDMSGWPYVLFSCTPISSKTEQFTESISAMTYLDIDQFDRWKNSFNTVCNSNNRGEEYELFKVDLERKVVERLSERFPNLKASIKRVYSSTPLTFRDYLGTPAGELYGIEKDFNNPMLTTINPKTKIPNLFLTGQSIVFHGILGATIGALVTSFNFVNGADILNTINQSK